MITIKYLIAGNPTVITVDPSVTNVPETCKNLQTTYNTPIWIDWGAGFVEAGV